MYPEKEGVALLRRSTFPRKRVKTATWGHNVNSEDFLIAEANHVQFRRRLDEIFLEIRRPDPSANLASISSANLRRSQMGHSADHQRTQAQQTDGFS